MGVDGGGTLANLAKWSGPTLRWRSKWCGCMGVDGGGTLANLAKWSYFKVAEFFLKIRCIRMVSVRVTSLAA